MNDATPILPSRRWIQLASGRPLYLDGTVAPLLSSDFAHALTRIPRFSGNTLVPYSVAAHTLGVYSYGTASSHPRREDVPVTYAEASLRLALLLHDDHEMVIGDIPTPAKSLFPNIKGVEVAISRIIRSSLALSIIGRPFSDSEQEWLSRCCGNAVVREADEAALQDERAALMAPSPLPWSMDLNTPNWRRNRLNSDRSALCPDDMLVDPKTSLALLVERAMRDFASAT